MTTPPQRRLLAAALALVVVAGVGCAASDTTSYEASGGCTSDQPAPGSTSDGVLSVSGRDRRYNLSVPPEAADRATPAPLVVNLHEWRGTDDAQDHALRAATLARQEGVVVVTPQAAEPGRVWDLEPGGPDVAFVEALVDHVGDELCIDGGRVYLTGFSMGGMMATALACADPGAYAAVAVVAGMVDSTAGCDRSEPVPLLAIHGSADDVLLPDGSYSAATNGMYGDAGPTRLEMAAAWAGVNGCDEAVPAPSADAATSVVAFRCPSGAEVVFREVEGGSHVWPGGPPATFASVTTTPADAAVDATALVWGFLRTHDRSP